MILTDSGFWAALLTPCDEHHAAAASAAERVRGENFVTTWPVLTEACYLILRDNGSGRVVEFVRTVQNGGCEIHDLPMDTLARIQTLMHKYRNLPMDLADASLVVLAEELDEARILSTDERDFKTYRWKRTKPFKNLLFEA